MIAQLVRASSAVKAVTNLQSNDICFSRVASFALGPSAQDAASNQIVPRYKAAKRRRLQAGLGGATLLSLDLREPLTEGREIPLNLRPAEQHCKCWKKQQKNV
jgi:hypothetical protein